MMKKLAVIILQYNNSQLTIDLLDSIYTRENDTSNWEIFVIDNNSKDDDGFEQLHTKFPDVILKKNSINMGFAGGVNSAIPFIQSEYILLINNDMILLNNAISRSLEEITKKSGDAIVCKIIGENNKIQNTSNVRLSVLNIFLGLFGYMRLVSFIKSRVNKSFRVGYINGAFLLIKSSVYVASGMLNDSFFMYGEDIDLMLRLNKANARMYYTPKGLVKHFDGASAKKVWNSEDKYLLKLGNSMKAHKLNKSRIPFCLLKGILSAKEIMKYVYTHHKLYLKAGKMALKF